MKPIVLIPLTVGVTIGTIVLIKQFTAADSVPLLGTAIVKVRSLIA